MPVHGPCQTGELQRPATYCHGSSQVQTQQEPLLLLGCDEHCHAGKVLIKIINAMMNSEMR